MSFSIFSFLTSLFISTLLIGGLNIYFKRSSLLLLFRPEVFLIILICPLFRLLFAIELPFTKVIETKTFYPELYSLFTDYIVGDIEYSLLKILLLCWGLGAIISFVKIVFRYYKLVISFRHIPICNNTLETHLVNRLFIERGIKVKKIKILKTSGVKEPMIYGIFPTIVLPSIPLSEKELENIIAHELGHYLHGDIIFKWLLEGGCALYWWFSPIRSLNKYIYYMMEIRADHFAVKYKSKSEKIEYMEVLLKVCKMKVNKESLQTTSLFSYGDNGTMKKRFNTIYYKAKKPSILKMLVAGIVTCTVMLASYSFVIQPKYEVPSTDQDAFDVTPDAFYWIINDEGGYDLYSNTKEFIGWSFTIPDELDTIPIKGGLK